MFATVPSPITVQVVVTLGVVPVLAVAADVGLRLLPAVAQVVAPSMVFHVTPASVHWVVPVTRYTALVRLALGATLRVRLRIEVFTADSAAIEERSNRTMARALLAMLLFTLRVGAVP